MPRVGRDRRVHAVNLLGVGYGSSASEILMNSEQPPRLGRGLLIRSALVGFAIVLLSAGAFSASAILRVDQAKDAWIGGPDRQIEVPELTRAEAGGARTFLILGSDQRWDDKKYDVPGRSDAIMMARVDPDKSTIAVLSILPHLFSQSSWRRCFPISATYSAILRAFTGSARRRAGPWTAPGSRWRA